jgi:hypothetical protein
MKIRNMIIVPVFLASLIFPALSHSFENETNGFLGLTWGADISAFEGMVAVRTTSTDGTIYKKDNGAIEAGGVTLTDTLYSFSSDGKLESVTTVIKDYKDFLALKAALVDKYGAVDDPLDEADEKYIWSGEMTSIYLSYNRKTEAGVLFAGPAVEKSVEEVY